MYVRDEGSAFDAPIEVVWNYLMDSGGRHAAAHQASARFRATKEISKNSSEATGDRMIDGRWSKFVARSTDFAPLAVVNEELEGDLAGSKFVLVYTPQRQRTRVAMYGDFQSETIPRVRLERVVLDLFATSYNEDVPGLAAFQRGP